MGLLKTSHVRLSCDEDLLIWNQSKYGKYTPRSSYLQLMLDRQEKELSWWWKVLWKFKCPLKANIFCWFILKDKALTWDVICCKGKEGPGRCYLCKTDSESNVHLGVDCSYTRQVWIELEAKLGLYNLWIGTLVSLCLKNWCMKGEVKHIRSLPIIVLWFIWKARNQSCFEDYVLSPF